MGMDIGTSSCSDIHAWYNCKRKSFNAYYRNQLNYIFVSMNSVPFFFQNTICITDFGKKPILKQKEQYFETRGNDKKTQQPSLYVVFSVVFRTRICCLCVYEDVIMLQKISLMVGTFLWSRRHFYRALQFWSHPKDYPISPLLGQERGTEDKV